VRRQRKAEPLGEQPKVAAVEVSPLVAEVVAELEHRRDAAHLATGDDARRVELARRVETPGVLADLLPPVPALVEDERMEVDLPFGRVTQDEARRLPRPRALVPPESEVRERGGAAVEIDPPNHQIEVVVVARLLAQQCVDAPPAIEPDVDPGQCVENLDDVRGGQSGMFPCFRGGRRSRLGRAVSSASISTGRVRRGSITSST
jgi:hypothetical protein